MTGGHRIGLLAAALAVLVVAFFLLSPGEDASDDTATTPATATTTEPATTAAPGETVTTAPKPPQPQYEVVRVAGGKPVGGLKAITVRSGARARIEVRSRDTSDEVHLHGYDIKRDLKAGGRVRFVFEADAEGIFAMELEGAHTQIAKIEVVPS